MSEIRQYPKIIHLGRRGSEELFLDEVVIQEKLDGSQLRFGFDDSGVLRFFSRGSEQSEANKLFAKAIEQIRKVESHLIKHAVYYGEVLVKPKHNLLAYERVPASNFALFDVYSLHTEQWFDHDWVSLHAEWLGFEPIPNLHVGRASSTVLDELLDVKSCLGGIIEGVVIKNYERGIFAKYVTADFREIKGQPPGPSPVKDGTTVDGLARILANSVSPEARMHKAVARMREDGRLLNGPEDIGPLIKAVQADVAEECTDYIKDELFNRFAKKIFGTVGARTARWYKERLSLRGSATEEFYTLPKQEHIDSLRVIGDEKVKSWDQPAAD